MTPTQPRAQAQHTPGEWRIYSIVRGQAYILAGAMDATIQVAELNRATVGNGPISSAEVEANARLVAAAPKMAQELFACSVQLEAARALIVQLLDGESNNSDANKVRDALTVHGERAFKLYERAMMGKAEGTE